jgi:hypothetical protein
MQKGHTIFSIEELPSWIQYVLTPEEKRKNSYSNIDEVREKYRQMNIKPKED